MAAVVWIWRAFAPDKSAILKDMTKRALLAVVVLFAVLGITWFVVERFFAPKPPPELVQVQYAQADTIVVRHTHTQNTHIYSGSLPVPGCMVLSSGVSTSGTGTTSVVLKLQTYETPPPCEDSAAATIVQEFQASLTTDKQVRFEGVTINDVAVEYRLEE